jgi:hypothetical protein
VPVPNKPYLAFIHLTIILAETLQRYVSRQLKLDGTAWSDHKLFQTLQTTTGGKTARICTRTAIAGSSLICWAHR